jgi:hypothetical protein
LSGGFPLFPALGNHRDLRAFSAENHLFKDFWFVRRIGPEDSALVRDYHSGAISRSRSVDSSAAN